MNGAYGPIFPREAGVPLCTWLLRICTDHIFSKSMLCETQTSLRSHVSAQILRRWIKAASQLCADPVCWWGFPSREAKPEGPEMLGAFISLGQLLDFLQHLCQENWGKKMYHQLVPWCLAPCRALLPAAGAKPWDRMIVSSWRQLE